MPPPPLIACRMIFAMVDGAERNGEFVADLQGKPLGLRKANVMGVGWGAAADQAGLLGDKAEVLLRADAFWLTKSEHTLIDFWTGFGRLQGMRVRHPVGQSDSANSSDAQQDLDR